MVLIKTTPDILPTQMYNSLLNLLYFDPLAVFTGLDYKWESEDAYPSSKGNSKNL